MPCSRPISNSTALLLLGISPLWKCYGPIGCRLRVSTRDGPRSRIGARSWRAGQGSCRTLTRPASPVSMNKCSFTAMSPWCCARKSSTAGRWRRATCSSAKTVSGGLPIITPDRSSAGTWRGGARRGSIEGRMFTGRFDVALEPPCAVVGGAHFGEAQRGLCVEAAVPALGPKAPLEGGDDRDLSARGDAVADGREIGERTGVLDNPNATAAKVAEVGRRLRPDPDTRAGKPAPVEKFTGVRLAV